LNWLKIYATAWRMRKRNYKKLQLLYVNLVVPRIPTRFEDEELDSLNAPCLTKSFEKLF